MFFKCIGQWVFLLSLLGLLSSCDYLKSSQPNLKEVTPVVLNLGELGCIRSLPKKVQGFLDDNITSSELVGAFECLDMSIVKFQSLTKANEEGAYRADEMRHFLNRYLLSENKISLVFMNEIMKFKSFALGGTESLLTRDELLRGRHFLKKMSHELGVLRGFIKLLTFQEPIKNFTMIGALSEKLLVTVSNLSEDISFNGDYSLKDFITLLRESASFADHSPFYDQIVKFEELILGFQKLFVGVGNNTQSRGQWLKAVVWGVETFKVSLEWSWLKNQKDKDSKSYWQKKIDWIDKLIFALKNSPQFSHHRRWHTIYLDQVVDSLFKLKVLNLSVSPEIFKSTYKIIIMRFLARDTNLSRLTQEITSISEDHLNYFVHEWDIWKDSQNWLLGLESLSNSAIVEKAKADRSRIKLSLGLTHSNSKEQAFVDWLELFHKDHFYSWASGKSLIFNTNPNEDIVNSLAGLTLFNTLRTVTRLLVLSYGSGNTPDPWTWVLKRADISRLEKDFFDLAVAMRVLDERVQDRSERFTQEANLFTLQGDGNSVSTSHELLELVSLLMVGGRFVAHEFLDTLTQSQKMGAFPLCPPLKNDSFGKPIMERSCLLTTFVGVAPQLFSSWKGFQEAWASLSLTEQMQWAEKIFSMGQVPNKEHDSFEFNEYRTSFVLMLYIESLLYRFDENRDGTLDYDELQKASPRFRQFVQTLMYQKFKGMSYPWMQGSVWDWLSKKASERDTFSDEVFLFVAYKGKIPDFSDLLVLQYEKFSGLPPLNRLDLVRVFSILKNAAHP